MAQAIFDTTTNRQGTHAIKHERFGDAIPMWVADMDFQSPRAIIDALKDRSDHGIYGYTAPWPTLNELTCQWLADHYDWQIQPEWLVWVPGLVPAFNVACRAFAQPNDCVAVQTPTYYPMLHAPGHHQMVKLDLTSRCIEGRWQLDWDVLRTQLANPKCKLLLLCNPMNPCGSVMSESELSQLVALCQEHQVLICSDEIHCDLILDTDAKHIPMGSLEPNSLTLMAASKTFNIAGLGCAFAVIPNRQLRSQFIRAAEGIVPYPNLMGYVATEAAFAHGEPWRLQLLDYLRGNRDWLVETIQTLPGLTTVRNQATYLSWIDASALAMENPHQFFLDNGVALSPGADFGDKQFVRLNFGCPRSQLTAAVDTMAKALDASS